MPRALLAFAALLAACAPAPLPPAPRALPPAQPPPPLPTTAPTAIATAPPSPRKIVVICNDCGMRPIERARFVHGSATIPRDAEPMLHEVVAVMKSHPDITSVAVEGHADNREGKPEALSRRRAEAVRDWLVAHGVEAARLAVMPYGSTRPLDDNATAEGRARNRRVEFRVVEKKEP